MAEQEHQLQDVILTRLMRLNAKIHGVVTGVVFGLGLFLATNWLVLKGGKEVGKHLVLLRHFFLGYRVTFIGSLIGFLYAFACGFVIGYTVARLYNGMADRRDRSADRAAK
jgi:hypothetical protein